MKMRAADGLVVNKVAKQVVARETKARALAVSAEARKVVVLAVKAAVDPAEEINSRK